MMQISAVTWFYHHMMRISGSNCVCGYVISGLEHFESNLNFRCAGFEFSESKSSVQVKKAQSSLIWERLGLRCWAVQPYLSLNWSSLNQWIHSCIQFATQTFPTYVKVTPFFLFLPPWRSLIHFLCYSSLILHCKTINAQKWLENCLHVESSTLILL